MKSLDDYLKDVRVGVNEELERVLPSGEWPVELHAAMRWAVFPGGKRLRPVICVASCEAAGGSRDAAIPAGAALELLHSYTLVHDDLPAMDNDEQRRGAPSCWMKFGEATAILAGDALLTRAFEVLARAPGSQQYASAAYVAELAAAAGAVGVVGGQSEDLQPDRADAQTSLHRIHEHKTAALMRVAARIGAMVAGAGEDLVDTAGSYGTHFGFAYQLADDLADAHEDDGRLSAPDVWSGDEIRRRIQEHTERAVAQARRLPGDSSVLEAFPARVLEKAGA